MVNRALAQLSDEIPSSAARELPLIRREHEQIAARLRVLAKSRPRYRRQALARLLVDLVAHAKAEEESLYSAVPPKVAEQGLNDHREAEHILTELILMRPTAKEWPTTARRLQRHVEDHMQWEEGVAMRLLEDQERGGGVTTESGAHRVGFAWSKLD